LARNSNNVGGLTFAVHSKFSEFYSKRLPQTIRRVVRRSEPSKRKKSMLANRVWLFILLMVDVGNI